MTIKRALLALIALMLLPALASAQPSIPPITPAPGTANIAVLLEFDDQNYEDSVIVNLSCSSGTISPSFVTLKSGEGQVFVVDNLPEGVNNTCTVTAVETDDYTALYLCAPNFGGADTRCQDPGDPSLISCEFNAVDAYVDGSPNDSVGYCLIENFPTPVDVDVHKVWEIIGAEQADFDPDVRITLNCDAEIVDGYYYNNGIWRANSWLYESDGDFDDEDDDYTGMGVATFKVIPEFYSTADDPEDQEYTECWATENIQDSAVEVTNGCVDLEVAAGLGDECTITNTVFFEGIPTLNQYGMAIMALLMLGVGFVGFRRFV
jgi:hypothetical protein